MIRIRHALMTLVYDGFLIFAFLIALPKLIYKRVKYGKYAKNLKLRFGLVKPKIPDGDHPVVWFHGASVGEILLLVPIVHRFIAEYPEWRCVVTACSESGNETAERLFTHLGVTTFILPLDLSAIIKPVVRAIRPALVVFSEGDCWLNFLAESKKVGATAVVINGKLSINSSKWFGVLKRFGRDCFSPIDGFMLQDEQYRQRFIQLGIPQDKLEVTGNIKTYAPLSLDGSGRAIWRDKLRLEERDELLVLGSTHPADVQAWLPALRQIKRKSLKVLWVPRHQERIGELESALHKSHMSFGFWSAGATFSDYDTIIVDVMGMLKQLYCAADVAFVGGTFDPKIGGHNLLEPLQCRVPLVFGPYIASQSDLALRLLSFHAGYCLQRVEDISGVLSHLLDCPEERNRYIAQGEEFLRNEQKSLDLTWTALKRYISCIEI